MILIFRFRLKYADVFIWKINLSKSTGPVGDDVLSYSVSKHWWEKIKVKADHT